MAREIESGTCNTLEGNLPLYNPPINHFDMNLFFLILGKRRTGKTHFLENFLFKKMQHFQRFLVLTDTKFNGFWQKIIPDKFVKDGFNEQYISTLFEIQKERKKDIQRKYSDLTDDEINCHPEFQVVLILDDVIGDKYTIRFGTQIPKLATQGRHYGITVFFISQYFYSVPSDCRANADVVVVLNQNQKVQIEGISETFLGILNKESAKKIIQVVACEKREIDDIYDEEYTGCDRFIRILIINIWANKVSPLETLAWYSAEAETPEYHLMDEKLYWQNKGKPAILSGNDYLDD